MKIFDSHCHLDDRSYDADRDAVMAQAQNAEVHAVMTVGVDLETARKAVTLTDTYPNCYASVGVHPHDAKDCSEAVLSELQQLAEHPKVVAWGETGLDYNRMYSPRKDQEKWFQRQVEIARERDMPLIFHERDSGGRFFELLTAAAEPGLPGVVHCFSGTESELNRYLEFGLYIGITGILTLKERGRPLRRMVKSIPADRLLVETDAPYLTPTPERNHHRRNEPAFVRTVLMRLAEVRQEDPETLAAAVWDNTCRLYKLGGRRN
jgi:TatD DNase family protein